MPRAPPVTMTTLSLSRNVLLQLECLHPDAWRALGVAHVRPDALGHGRGVALGEPLGALGHLGMLELVEREVRRRADHRAIAPAADHARHLLVVRHVD